MDYKSLGRLSRGWSAKNPYSNNCVPNKKFNISLCIMYDNSPDIFRGWFSLLTSPQLVLVSQWYHSMFLLPTLCDTSVVVTSFLSVLLIPDASYDAWTNAHFEFYPRFRLALCCKESLFTFRETQNTQMLLILPSHWIVGVGRDLEIAESKSLLK